MGRLEIRAADESDRKWMTGVIKARWGEERVVVHGTAFRPAELPAFVAFQDDDRVGLLTFHPDNETIEIITIDSLKPRGGVGSKMLDAMKDHARRTGCRRLWLITTNDNLNTLGFYQKRGFALVALHRNALDLSRMIKPIIPFVGLNGIPLRDELELELVQ
jgi:N-acetylglutamate synthase-like GNAT family acetyltransferase